MKRVWLILPVLALSGCAPAVLGAPGWEFVALRTKASVKLVPAREFGFCAASLVGCTAPLGQGCVILLDRTYFLNGTPYQKTMLLAHEFGHCLDASHLALTHNHFGNAGRMYGPYYTRPVEGFAEAYAHAYYAKCGTNLAALGWKTASDTGSCTPPDPRTVKPPPESP